MKKILALFVCVLFLPLGGGQEGASACTNLIVGKKASKDGSVIITYSSDDYGSFGFLRCIPAADHPAGTMHPIYHYESNNYLGEIPEMPHTYGVVGLMNEYQLTIHETTWGGREELVDTISGVIDYGSLMVLGLQRAKTAREAIKVMTELVDTYGYESEGESFTIADPKRVGLPSPNVSSSYMFCTGNDFFGYPNNFNYYAQYYRNTFQHGGISLEEMLIPLITLDPK